jgi:hypothetical protein
MDSWKEIFNRFEDLSVFKGIITDLLEAELHMEVHNMNILIDFLKGYLERMDNTKIAIVTNTPQMTNTIMMDQRMKHVQIKPFTTMRAAFDWIAD